MLQNFKISKNFPKFRKLKFVEVTQVLVEIIRFKITIYLVINQNNFEFSSESRVYENEHFAEKSPVCFLIYRNKVRHPSTAKDIVYQTKVRGINDLQHRIIEAIDTVTVDMLARAWQEIKYRLDIVRTTDGAHVAVY